MGIRVLVIQAMVAVFVAHDATTDEWVCQIPYFPPFQSPEVITKHVINHKLLLKLLL